MLRKGFNRRSKSPYGANLTSASKPDGSIRWCIDYRRLNAITINDKTPLPLISESLVLLGRARLYTPFDLRSAFNQVVMDPNSVDKTAFVTREGCLNVWSCPLVSPTPLPPSNALSILPCMALLTLSASSIWTISFSRRICRNTPVMFVESLNASSSTAYSSKLRSANSQSQLPSS